MAKLQTKSTVSKQKKAPILKKAPKQKEAPKEQVPRRSTRSSSGKLPGHSITASGSSSSKPSVSGKAPSMAPTKRARKKHVQFVRNTRLKVPREDPTKLPPPEQNAHNHISKLPDLVIREIFGNITELPEQIKLRRVCPQWAMCVQSLCMCQHSYVELDLPEKYNLTGQSLFLKLFPNVQHLKLSYAWSCRLLDHDWINTIAVMKNLTELTLVNFSLDTRINQYEVVPALPTVRKLHIGAHNLFSKITRRDPNGVELLHVTYQKFGQTLAKRFPHLEELNIYARDPTYHNLIEFIEFNLTRQFPELILNIDLDDEDWLGDIDWI